MVSNHPGLPCARSHTPDVFATRGHTERHGRIRLLRRLAAPADAACSYLAGALQRRPDMLQRRIHGRRRVYRRMAMGRVACHCDVGNIPQLLGIMLETVAWAALGGALSAGILLVYCARWGLSDTAALWLAAIRSPGSAVFGAVSAALIAGATIRESQLFRYFKDR